MKLSPTKQPQSVKTLRRKATGGEVLMQRPSQFVNQYLYSKNLLIVLFIAAVSSQGWILYTLGSIQHDVGAMQTISLIRPGLFREITMKWTEADVQKFQKHFLLDKYIHPILYSFFFCVWATYESNKNDIGAPIRFSSWLFLICLAGLFDITENTIHSYLLNASGGLSTASDFDIRLAALFATCKWLITIPTGLWLTFALINRIRTDRMLQKEQQEEETSDKKKD